MSNQQTTFICSNEQNIILTCQNVSLYQFGIKFDYKLVKSDLLTKTNL